MFHYVDPEEEEGRDAASTTSRCGSQNARTLLADANIMEVGFHATTPTASPCPRHTIGGCACMRSRHPTSRGSSGPELRESGRVHHHHPRTSVGAATFHTYMAPSSDPTEAYCASGLNAHGRQLPQSFLYPLNTCSWEEMSVEVAGLCR